VQNFWAYPVVVKSRKRPKSRGTRLRGIILSVYLRTGV
jgi:hypothetical protein